VTYPMWFALSTCCAAACGRMLMTFLDNGFSSQAWVSAATFAHFREQRNAVTYKRQLEARGETVHVQKSTVYAFSEATKAEWFMDYEPKAPPVEPPGTSQSTAEPNPLPPVDGPGSSDRRRESWYRRWFGG
jgi:hypothetical protein